MKTIGVIGGMGWAASAIYYRILNEEVRRRLGDLHSARVVLDSLDHATLAGARAREDWKDVATQLRQSARRLERAGADFLLIACNTVHRVAEEVDCATTLPLLHIADAAGAALRTDDIGRVAILGTRLTMEGGFYAERLREGFGIESLLPSAEDRNRVDSAIFGELVHGSARPATVTEFGAIVERLRDAGAEAVLLACTELSLLRTVETPDGSLSDRGLPLYDTTEIHALAAVDHSLEQ